MDTIHLIVLAAALFFFAVVVAMTAKNKLTDQYAFMWLLFSGIGLGMAIALPYLNSLANSIGVAYMPSLIFLLAFLLILSLLIYHTALLSKQERRVRILVQEVAFLQRQIKHLGKEEN